ncbi:MAG: peptidylprolyl isomerase [Pseudomonadales bacterium]
MSYDELLQHEVRTWSPEETPRDVGTSNDIMNDSLIASDAAMIDEANPRDDGVSVNGVEISARAINVESANYEGGTILERQHQAAVALVVRELLLQRATELELPTVGGDLDEDDVIDQLLDKELTVPEPDTAACRRYFDNHQDKFRSADLFEVSHILIAADPRDEDARAVAKKQARAAIQLLADDPKRFAELAAELSDCPSKNSGGNMGQIGKGQTVPEFEDVLFRMHHGELSRSPVESRYGFHVIYLQRRIDGAPLPFETVREKIADYLRDSVNRQAIGQYLRILVGRAEISGIEMEGSEILLVQ